MARAARAARAIGDHDDDHDDNNEHHDHDDVHNHDQEDNHDHDDDLHDDDDHDEGRNWLEIVDLGRKLYERVVKMLKRFDFGMKIGRIC